ncbi:MAG: hypothetical protein GY860_15250, partial [Desulfobacteraceae bacterium]|nr:hypothetical protein [Desulfobacteraceae bacterium]
MPAKKRIRTVYPGVYYVLSAFVRNGKQERIYYIRYRKNGRLFEEKAGGQFQNKMTPEKAAKIRVDCMEGKRLSKREIRKKRQLETASAGDQGQTQLFYPAGDKEPRPSNNEFKYSGHKIIPEKRSRKL